MTLSADQNEAIKKLRKYKIGALFMEPGTGKTLTAIQLIKTTKTNLVLFLTPCSNKENIKREFKKWHLNNNYLIVGIESLSSSDRLFVDLINQLSTTEHIFMVVDESLKIKNKNAIRSNRIVRLGKFAEFRLILNGTPLSKNILDIWNQMEFLSPKILNMGYDQFKDTFINYIVFDYRGEKNTVKIKGYSNLGYLYSLISPFIYDCELSIEPHRFHENITYDITEGRPNYEFAKEKYIGMIMNDPNVFMAMVQEMQHSYSLEPSKIEITRKYATSKTIIFCKYVDTKEKLIESFPQCLVMTYGTGSLGLNLQQYNQIVFFDKTFDYAQKEQAEHRIYRMGQNDNCHFINLTGNVGLEHLINNNIKNKTTLLNGFKTAVINDDTKVILNEL